MKVNTLIKYYRGTSDKLPDELMEGTIYYITDENKFYIDIDGRRSVLDAEKANYLVKGQVAISLDDLYLKQEIDDKIALTALRWEPYDYNEGGGAADDSEINGVITLKTGIPLGGKKGQILTKTSNDNYAAEWRTIEISADIDGIDISNLELDASKITSGVIDIARIPKAAMEQCIVVTNDSYRFQLTSDRVQVGDTVKVADTGLMYLVVDENNLNNESGYVEYSAGYAEHADRLTTSRYIGNVVFDGTKNITLKQMGAVPETRTINGYALDQNITLDKADVNLDKVDNTPDIQKKVAEANKLSVGRKIGEATFDGSKNISLAEMNAAAATRTINGQPLTADVTLSKADVGLNNVENMPNSERNVLSATKLTTARTINGVSFDGTANIDINRIPAQNAKNLTASGTAGNQNIDLPLAGLQVHKMYNNSSTPTTYGNLIGINGTGAGELFLGWSGSGNDTAHMYYRSHRDNASNAWGPWKTVAFTDDNVTSATKLATARTINGTSFDGTGNITTANWGTARDVYISDSAGSNLSDKVSVNGSGNITLKMPGTIAGITTTANITYNMNNSTQIPFKIYGGDVNGQGISIGGGGATIVGAGESAKSCESLLAATSEDLWLTSDQSIKFYTKCQTIGNKVGVILDSSRYFYPDTDNTGSLGTSSYKWASAYATNFYGALTGNASTATKLATARTINGTSFDGTSNITTANWGTARNIYISDSDGTDVGTAVSVNGSANVTLKLPGTIKATLSGSASSLTTARTLTIGNTGKTFNGTANVSWTLAEIGAVDLARNMVRHEYYVQTIDLTSSSYNVNTYYPVTGTYLTVNHLQYLAARSPLNAAFGKPSWSTHNSGFFSILELYDNGHGWGASKGGSNHLELINTNGFVSDGLPPATYYQMDNSSIPVFFLRGGAKYDLYTDYSCTWTVRTSTYTSNSQSVAPAAYASVPKFGIGKTMKINISGNAATATKLATARNITIGNATKSFDGSANITFTADEIGMQSQVWHKGTTAPTNTKLLWIDTTANTGGLKYHNGTSWVHVPVAYT